MFTTATDQRGRTQIKSQQLTLFSGDSTIDSNGDYSFFIDLYPIQKAKSILLNYYNIFWTFPNVTPFTNTIVFNEGIGNITTTIPVGNYDILGLMTAIGTAMTNAGTQTYTLTYNIYTSIITITGATKAFTIIFTPTTMKDLIGLTANISSIAPFKVSLQTSIDLLPTKELQIRLPNLLRTAESGNNSSLIYVVPLSGSSYGSALTNNIVGIEVESSRDNMAQVVVSIVDNSGFTPDGFGTQPFTLVFQVNLK